MRITLNSYQYKNGGIKIMFFHEFNIKLLEQLNFLTSFYVVKLYRIMGVFYICNDINSANNFLLTFFKKLGVTSITKKTTINPKFFF